MRLVAKKDSSPKHEARALFMTCHIFFIRIIFKKKKILYCLFQVSTEMFLYIYERIKTLHEMNNHL